MVVDEGQRRVLHQRLVEVMGVDQADVLMDYLPPSGWGDVARRSDLDHLERILNTKLDSLGIALRGEINSLRGDMGGLAGGLRAEMAKQSRTVLVSSVTLVVSVVGSLIAALVTLPH
jgi:hypothetical protein